MTLRTGVVRTLAFPLVLLAAGFLLGMGRSEAPTPREPMSAAAAAVLPDLEGDWAGQWYDTTFDVPGPMTMSVMVAGADVTAAGTMDLTGVGLGNSEPFTLTGTISGNTLNFTVAFDAMSALTATGSGTVNDAGTDNLTGDGDVGLPLNFGTFNFTCTVTASTIDGTFGGYGSGGAGTIALTKSSPVEPSTWTETKAAYRSGESR